MFVINGAFRGQRVTGPQRYATEMSSALTSLVPDCEELSPSDRWLRAGKIGAWAWTQSALPTRARRIPLLSLTARAPMHHSCHVVTVHDLFPLTHPEWYSRQYVALHGPLLAQLLRRAAAIVAVSEPVARDIRELGLTAASTPIVVAPNAPSESLMAGTAEHVGPEIASILGGGRYFLTVGSEDPRKNLRAVMTAYLALDEGIRRSMPLVVVGGANPVFASQGESLHHPTIRRLGYVTDEELAALYAGPATLVSASLDEGFGLPLVEANGRGCRLLLSDIPVYRWVCDEAADYFDPRDPDSIRSALLREARAATLEPTRDLPRTYAWKDSARVVADLMDRIGSSQD